MTKYSQNDRRLLSILLCVTTKHITQGAIANVYQLVETPSPVRFIDKFVIVVVIAVVVKKAYVVGRRFGSAPLDKHLSRAQLQHQAKR